MSSAPRKRIAVHDQNWHADDCLSVYFLKQTAEFRDATVHRTRNLAELETYDAVCDAGGRYNHRERRYDHHQPGFREHFPGFQTTLSACGTIYLHWGEEILTGILAEHGRAIGRHAPFLIETMYREFIREIDESDNGATQFPADVSPPYIVHTGISQRIAMTNPGQPDDRGFEAAWAMIGREFGDKLLRIFDCDVPAIELLEDAIRARAQFGGRVVVLDVCCPPAGRLIEWAERSIAETERSVAVGEIAFFAMPERREWRVHAVSPARMELPAHLEEMPPGVLRVHRRVAVCAGRREAIEFARACAEGRWATANKCA